MGVVIFVLSFSAIIACADVLLIKIIISDCIKEKKNRSGVHGQNKPRRE